MLSFLDGRGVKPGNETPADQAPTIAPSLTFAAFIRGLPLDKTRLFCFSSISYISMVVRKPSHASFGPRGISETLQPCF